MTTVVNFIKKKFDKQSKFLFRNTSWILGSSIYRSGAAFLRSIIIARGLGVEFYGIYVLITTFVSAMQDFFNLNVGAAFIKFGAGYKAENRNDKMIALAKGCLLATLVTATISVATVCLLVSMAYDKFVTTPGLETYIILYAIADIATFFDPVGRSFLRLFYKFKANAIVQSTTVTIEFLTVATVVLIFPQDLKLFFIALVSVKIFNMLVNNGWMIYELRKEFMPHIGSKISLLKNQWKEISGFVLGNSITKTLQAVISNGDVLLLGAMTGPSVVAFYNVGKKLANAALSIFDPLVSGLYPQLANLLYQKRYEETKVMLLKLTRTILFSFLIILPVLFFIRYPLISFIYGTEYVSGADPFFVCSLAVAVASVFFWNQSYMQSAGLIRFRLFVHILAIVAGGLTAWLLIPHFSAVGAALGVLVARIVLNIFFTTRAFNHLEEIKITG